VNFLKYRLCHVKCRYIVNNKMLVYIISVEQVIKKFVNSCVVCSLFIKYLFKLMYGLCK